MDTARKYTFKKLIQNVKCSLTYLPDGCTLLTPDMESAFALPIDEASSMLPDLGVFCTFPFGVLLQ